MAGYSSKTTDAARAKVARAASLLADAVIGHEVPPARRIVMTDRPIADPETDECRDLARRIAALKRRLRPSR